MSHWFRLAGTVSWGLALALTAGCPGGVAIPESPQGAQAATGTLRQSAAYGDLILQPQILPGGIRTVSAIVNNFTKASVNHLVVKLFLLNGSVETAVLNGTDQVVFDIPGDKLDETVKLAKLRANVTYRVRAYAYKAAGEADSNLISTADRGSYVDVSLTHEDRPTLAKLVVQLIDVEFSGLLQPSGVAVTDGGFKTTGPETITF